MPTDDEQFRFAYEPGVIRYGEESVQNLSGELAGQGFDRALVVCGRTVGSTPEVIDPVREGLGERLAGVFAETTPKKRLGTAVSGVERMQAVDADALVGLGGGSSLDVAKAMQVVAGSDRDPAAIGEEFEATGTITVPESVPPLFAIPTTLAGADLSQLAGLTASPESGLVEKPVRGGLDHPRLMPAGLFYDPDIVATTPREILAGSAMNGFDKGIETLYARNRTPITDATAARGIRLLRDGLPTLADDRRSWDMASIVQGIVLVQYGISRPDGTTLSLIHAFGHGLKAHADVQQGVAHAVVAPHALAYLFEAVDGNRDLLAEALAVPTEGRSREDTADGIVSAVAGVRDALGLPARLRDVDAIERSALDAMARTTVEDSLLENCPPGLDPTEDELRAVLERAW